ncbi:hypothetical protein VPH35_022085 [Triticum aestivum]
MGGGRGWGFRENLQGSFSRLAFRAARGRGRERGGGEGLERRRARAWWPACLPALGVGAAGPIPFSTSGAGGSPLSLWFVAFRWGFSFLLGARCAGGRGISFSGEYFLPGLSLPVRCCDRSGRANFAPVGLSLGGEARACDRVRAAVGWMDASSVWGRNLSAPLLRPIWILQIDRFPS